MTLFHKIKTCFIKYYIWFQTIIFILSGFNQIKMKKILTLIIIVFIAITGSVFAYQNIGMNKSNNTNNNLNFMIQHEKGKYYTQIKEIILNGTYNDLVELRTELNIEVMKKIQSENDFEFKKQKFMYRLSRGLEPGYKLNNNFNKNYNGNYNKNHNINSNNKNMNTGHCRLLNK